MVIYLCVLRSGTPACYKYLTYSYKSFNLLRHVLEFRSCQNQSKITLISSLHLTEQNWDLHDFFSLTQAINDKGRFQDSASGFPAYCSSITPWHRVDVIYLELHHGDDLLFQNCRKNLLTWITQTWTIDLYQSLASIKSAACSFQRKQFSNPRIGQLE